MAQFPEDPKPSYPVIIEPEWKTIISGMDSGAEQRRQKWSFAKYNVTLKFNRMTVAKLQTLWDFYQARKGAAQAFHYYIPRVMSYEDLYIGYGDGETATFDIPGKSTSSQSIYVNGVLQGSGYSILTGGGDSGSDRVQFDANVGDGDLVTCDFTGFLRNRCRFAEDKMSYEWFVYAVYRTGLKLKGLSFAE